MSTSLTFDEHVSAIESSGARLGEAAARAGLGAPVPTCPTWTVDDLVAHQAMVHRWSTAHVRGHDPDESPTQTQILETVDELLPYYGEGVAALIAALCAAPVDLEAMTFLKDAPTPRQFWARRQAHETTMHMVDALAAEHGHVPATGDVAISAAFAADGIDELVRGFFPRGKSKLFAGTPWTIVIAPDDSARRWVLRVDEKNSVDDGDDDVDDTDARFTGSAVGLYLALWNRGDDIRAEGAPEVLTRWRETQQVKWS